MILGFRNHENVTYAIEVLGVNVALLDDASDLFLNIGMIAKA
jgi:hypothetical protein